MLLMVYTKVSENHLKVNTRSAFFLTVRNSFYCSLEISLTREWFTCARNKPIETVQKKVQFNPTFFWTVADGFETLFFHPMRFLAMGHVTRNMFSYLNFFCLLYYILQLYYCIVSITFCWKPYRTVPIRSVSNRYCILDQDGTVHWTEQYRTIKKIRSG